MVETSERSQGDWPGERETTEPSRRPGSHFLVLFAILGATACLPLLAFFTEPDTRGFGTHEQLGFAPCRMIEWTGVPCPGCGVTTSVTLAVQGRPLDAAMVQPFGLLTAITLPLLALWALVGHLRGVDLYRQIEERRAPWVRGGLLLMLAAWIYKIVIT